MGQDPQQKQAAVQAMTSKRKLADSQRSRELIAALDDVDKLYSPSDPDYEEKVKSIRKKMREEARSGLIGALDV